MVKMKGQDELRSAIQNVVDSGKNIEKSQDSQTVQIAVSTIRWEDLETPCYLGEGD